MEPHPHSVMAAVFLKIKYSGERADGGNGMLRGGGHILAYGPVGYKLERFGGFLACLCSTHVDHSSPVSTPSPLSTHADHTSPLSTPPLSTDADHSSPLSNGVSQKQRERSLIAVLAKMHCRVLRAPCTQRLHFLEFPTGCPPPPSARQLTHAAQLGLREEHAATCRASLLLRVALANALIIQSRWSLFSRVC